MNIEMTLDVKSINKVIKELEKYKQDMENKTKIALEKLASIGVVDISLGYMEALTGVDKIDVTSEWVSDNTIAIKATGKEVAFVEFGAGLIGYGHPLASKLGVGPGTYPEGKGNWNNPKGWWYKDATGSHHTYGNYPSMVMYNATKKLEAEVERVFMEVFG